MDDNPRFVIAGLVVRLELIIMDLSRSPVVWVFFRATANNGKIGVESVKTRIFLKQKLQVEQTATFHLLDCRPT